MAKVEEMTRDEIKTLLKKLDYGHLACARDNRPYIVPIHFAYEEPNIYLFTTEGMKTGIIDENPEVCLQTGEFMEDQLNVVLTLEYYIAIFYFSKLTGSLIPTIQPNTNIGEAFAKFRSTTWDILLLRIPTMQLLMRSDNFTDLGFIATADSSFANLAGQFIIGGIVPLPHNKKIEGNVFLYREEKLVQTTGEDIIRELEELN